MSEVQVAEVDTFKPWHAGQPRTRLTANALRLLEWSRDTGNLGRNYRRLRTAKVLGLTAIEMRSAARELRSSVWAGQFRPRPRVPIPRDMRARLLKRDGGRCQVCGEARPSMLTLGHYPVPYSRGGSDHHTNLRVECESCNTAIGDTEPKPTTTNPTEASR